MSFPTGDQQTVLEAAEEGALVLTANKRLARHLHHLFDERMKDLGRPAWTTPEIHSVDAWLIQALEIVGEGWRVLGPTVAQHLWEHVIEGDAAGDEDGLLQIGLTARRAREAHELLAEYGVDLDSLPLSEDHRAFLRWRTAFRKRCRAEGWIDPAAVAARVDDAIRQGELSLPAAALLVGFDDLPPRVGRLAAALASRGCRVVEVPPSTSPRGTLLRLACADVRDEVRQAACWARRLLEAGQGRIGIVVPDLKGYRSYIERIFREEIDPFSLVSISADEGHFSLSLGGSLAARGPIKAALEILACRRRITMARASYLLRTPFLGASLSEADVRARLDRNLRALGAEEFSLSDLIALAAGQRGDKGRGGIAPRMARIFSALEKALAEGQAFSPGIWAKGFSALLSAVGWPGERPLASLDYQICKAWQEKVMPALAALDVVTASLSREKTLALLRRLAEETEFQPESPEGGIQVIGHLEAAGLFFDHLWVMGLHEDVLPAPPRPNPFIPIPLQVACGMPHADAAREAVFARQVLDRLLAAAPRVILSHPLAGGDCALRPSPLIRDLPAGELPREPSRSPTAVYHRATPDLEGFADEHAPPLAPGEKAFGGTAILRDQALCPFRAFARHRLAVRALEAPGIGLDAATRGTLVHRVLKHFWDRTGNLQALQALGEEGRPRRVAACVETALAEQFPDRAPKPSDALLSIERVRLCRVVEEWLDAVELQRPAFTVVEREERHRETFGGVAFDTQIDRIDELSDGSRIIVDYKTGRIDLNDLLGERLLEPQLPVYGIGAGGERLAGVAFAVLRRGECVLRGVACGEDVLPDTPALADSSLARKHGLTGWTDLLAHWQRRLQALGEDFAGGEATVDPVSFQKACRYCDLPPFCRIDEIGLIREHEEVEP